MLFRLITSGYTDAAAYISALCAALWIYATLHYAAVMPGYLAAVSPAYGLVVAAFSAALLICKYICMEGNEEKISQISAEKSMLEAIITGRDLTLAELKQKSAVLDAEISALRSKIVVLEENSLDRQLTDLRTKLRSAEEDKKSALSVLVKSLQGRIALLMTIQDPQLLFAADAEQAGEDAGKETPRKPYGHIRGVSVRFTFSINQQTLFWLLQRLCSDYRNILFSKEVNRQENQGNTEKNRKTGKGKMLGNNSADKNSGDRCSRKLETYFVIDPLMRDV